MYKPITWEYEMYTVVYVSSSSGKMEITDITNDAIISFSKKVFEFLNGKINPYIKARKIKFIERDVDFMDDDEYIDYEVNAVEHFGEIILFVDDTREILINLLPEGVNIERSFKGFLIGIIAHELSHVDQYIPWYAYMTNSKEDNLRFNAYEYANEMNTLAFINQFHQMIVFALGPFSLPLYESGSKYLLDKDAEAYMKNHDITYKKLTDYPHAFWNRLSEFLHFDTYHFWVDTQFHRIDISIDNPYKHYIKETQIDTSFVTDPTTHMAKKTLKELNQLLATEFYNGESWVLKIYWLDDEGILYVDAKCEGAGSKFYEIVPDTKIQYNMPNKLPVEEFIGTYRKGLDTKVELLDE